MIAGNRRVEATRVNTRSRPSPRTQAVNGEPSQTPMTGRFRATTRSRLKPSTHENRCSRRELPIGNRSQKSPTKGSQSDQLDQRRNASNPPIQGSQSNQPDQRRKRVEPPDPRPSVRSTRSRTQRVEPPDPEESRSRFDRKRRPLAAQTQPPTNSVRSQPQPISTAPGRRASVNDDQR